MKKGFTLCNGLKTVWISSEIWCNLLKNISFFAKLLNSQWTMNNFPLSPNKHYETDSSDSVSRGYY